MTLRPHRARPGLLAALVTALLCTGCVPQGLAFRLDDRLTITSPKDRATVTLPVTLRWDIEEFDVEPPGSPVREDAGYFAVFIDRAPMPPGEPLAWLTRNDKSCRPAEGCPDAAYLAQLGIYTTPDTQLVVDQVRSRSGNGRQRHTATIVLLDGAGKRIGESAFEVAFDVDRGDQP